MVRSYITTLALLSLGLCPHAISAPFPQPNASPTIEVYATPIDSHKIEGIITRFKEETVKPASSTLAKALISDELLDELSPKIIDFLSLSISAAEAKAMMKKVIRTQLDESEGIFDWSTIHVWDRHSLIRSLATVAYLGVSYDSKSDQLKVSWTAQRNANGRRQVYPVVVVLRQPDLTEVERQLRGAIAFERSAAEKHDIENGYLAIRAAILSLLRQEKWASEAPRWFCNGAVDYHTYALLVDLVGLKKAEAVFNSVYPKPNPANTEKFLAWQWGHDPTLLTQEDLALATDADRLVFSISEQAGPLALRDVIKSLAARKNSPSNDEVFEAIQAVTKRDLRTAFIAK